MAILLRRTVIDNIPNIGLPFIATEVYFNQDTRKPTASQFESSDSTVFELAKDAEVYRYEYLPGKTRVVYYNGNGSVYTKNLAVTAGPFSPSLKIKAAPATSYTSAPNTPDACLDLTGQDGFPPYQLEVIGTSGNAKGYSQTATSPLESYPVRFYNLASGEYLLRVRDATGDGRTKSFTVADGSGQADALGALIQEIKVYNNSPLGLRTKWSFNALAVVRYPLIPEAGGQDKQTPYGTLLDGYLLPGSAGATWRQVYSDGKDNVYFVDTSTSATSALELDNLILFNPDTTAEQNGGVIVEVQGGAPPLLFSLTGPAGTSSNATGRFDRLAGGEYTYSVTDALGGSITGPLLLEDRYRLWRFLAYDDLDKTPMRVEFWRQDYDGPAKVVFLTDEPVSIKSDGLSTQLGGQGDLPSVVGTSAEINILAEPDLFEAVVTGTDRNCRVDYYYQDQLHFRGYVKPDIFTQPLLDGLQPTSLLATDGLADLKDADMLGHVGQRLGGHRPVLHTLLHCLSRCQIALPLEIFTNRRDAAMATLDAPEEAATTNRTGYYDEEKAEPADQRTVTDALAQLLGGTLVQRQGTWQVRSALEAGIATPGRRYQPAGTALGMVVSPAPSGVILPPEAGRWHWLGANQTKQVRSGWKSLAGTTDAGWLKNAFWQGEVFNDINAWLEDYRQLRATNGWYPPAGMSFPLVLERVGEKGKDHSTRWPRSTNRDVRDGRYLNSPPLPLAVGPEAVHAYLNFTGKLVGEEYYLDYDNNVLPTPTTAPIAYLPYEVLLDGRSVGVKLVEIARVDGSAAKDITVEIQLAPLPAGTMQATMRVYSWTCPETNLLRDAPSYNALQAWKKGDVVRDDYATGQKLFVARRDQAAYFFNNLPPVFLPPEEWAPIVATNAASGQLLLTSIGIQLRPQGATWEAADSFRADGPGGTLRPTEALKVYHPDVPIEAGLFSGNLSAFGKGVGTIDNTMTTSWARAIDKDASTLLAANVFDALALRANNARLLPGTIRHRGIAPPYLLDSVDAPNDLPARRFLVGSAAWHTKAAEVEVSLIEIGAADDAPIRWPDGARITHAAYPVTPGRYVPYLRIARGGVRIRHG